MSKPLGLFALALSLVSIAFAQGEERLWILNKAAASVSVVDPASGKIECTIAVGEGPHEAVISPDGRLMAVSNYGSNAVAGNTVSVIDTTKRQVLRTVDLGKFDRPHGMAFSPDGRRLFVTAERQKCVSIVTVDDGTVEARIGTEQSASHMIVLSADGKRAFVANIGSGSVSVLDLENRSLVKTVPTGAGCEGIALRPGRNEIWVTNRGADTLSLISTETLEVTATLPCASFPIRIAFTPDGARALVSCAKSDAVAVFSCEERKEVARIAMPPRESGEKDDEGRLFGNEMGSAVPVGILVHPEGKVAFVANTYADRVAVLDLEKLTLRGSLRGGKEPDGLAFSRKP